MASISNAVGNVFSGTFMVNVVFIAVGTLAATYVTDAARNNIVDIQQRGGDALYALAGAVVTMLLPGVPMKYKRPLALGMVTSGALTVGQEFGVV